MAPAHYARGSGSDRQDCGWARRRNEDGPARTNHSTVGASGNFDQQRVGMPFAGVVLKQAEAETASLDADGVVDSRVIGATVEDIEGDRVLLKRVVRLGYSMLDDIAKEELAAKSAGEAAGVEDALQLRENGVAVRLRDWNRDARNAQSERLVAAERRAGENLWHSAPETVLKLLNLRVAECKLRAGACQKGRIGAV